MNKLGWMIGRVGLAGLVCVSGACQPRVVNAPTSPPRAIREGDASGPAVALPSETASARPVLVSGAGNAKPGVMGDPTIVPTLDKERQAQAAREAEALGASVGVRVERISTLERPAWYAIDRADATNAEGWKEYVGQGRGEKLRDAYDAAARLARTGLMKHATGVVGPTDVARAAYVRTETGEYVVWVLVRGK